MIIKNQFNEAIFFPILIFFLLLPLLACANTLPVSEKMVDVGGYKINAKVGGIAKEENPTVILISGLADTSDIWDKIQSKIGKYTRVISYDRAGLGKSGTDNKIRTLDVIAEELNQLLKNSNINGPYIIVAHSIGGLYARKYMNRYPSDIEGLILIDASSEYENKPLDNKSMKNLSKKMKPGAKAEANAINRNLKEAKKLLPIPKNINLAVITSMKKSAGMTEKKLIKHYIYQQKWVDEVTNGIHISTSGSGHYIQCDEPDIVLLVIKKMFDYISNNK